MLCKPRPFERGLLHHVALEQVGGHLSGPWDEDLAAITATYLESDGEFLVGVEDLLIVAMGALRKEDDDRTEIKRMRVHRACSDGMGRRVLRRIERRAIELGYRTLVLDATTGQRAAQALYRSEGYTETGRRRTGALRADPLREARRLSRLPEIPPDCGLRGLA